MADTRNRMITGRDGFYVNAWREHGAWWLVAGHDTVVGGLFGEWSDSESDRARRNRARRMIAAARRENPELRRPTDD